MASDWEQSRPMYAALTIAKDGDDTEQYGCLNYQLDERWPAYQTFWRYHVAPATERPSNIRIREGVSRPILNILHANYRTYSKVVAVCDFTGMLRTDVSFSRTDDWRKIYSLHSSTIDEFRRLFEGVSEILRVLELPTTTHFSNIDDWVQMFEPYQLYWNYLSQLNPESVDRFEYDGQTFAFVQGLQSVFDRTRLGPRTISTTTDQSIRLTDAVQILLDELIRLLNVGSEQLVRTLEPAQELTRYHRLWGWYRG